MRNRLAVSLGMFMALAASSAFAQAPVESAPVPRVEIVAQYSYWEPHGSAGGVRFRSLNSGAIFSGSYYLTSLIGVEAEAGYHAQTANAGMYSISGGPIVRIPRKDLTPFAHVLIGGANITGPNAPTIGQSTYQFNPASWGLDITAGGGLEYHLPMYRGHLGARLFQVDFQTIRGISNPVPGATGLNITATRVSTGLLYSF